MAERGTAYRRSWGHYFQRLLVFWFAGLAVGFFGYFLFQADDLVGKVIGGAFILGGAMAALIAPFLPRPGTGDCPSCGGVIVGAGEEPLLCPQCAAYARVRGNTLQLEDVNECSGEPVYAAALPWDDIVSVKKETVAFSAQDYFVDKMRDLTTKNKGLRVLDSWPGVCCMCGDHATRTADHVVPLLIRGPAKGVLVARAVPYCARHSDGLAFGSVDYAVSALSSMSAPTTFGIKFRSHAFREKFRKLNPYKFATEVAGPLRIRKVRT